VKAAIAAISNRQPLDLHPSTSSSATASNSPAQLSSSGVPGQCPRCTYQNDSAMTVCEICQAPLVYSTIAKQDEIDRTESPGPFLNERAPSEEPLEVKFSFRAGGEKIYYERLRSALVQRKWLLQNAPPIPKPNGTGSFQPGNPHPNLSERGKTVGIAGLERRGLEQRKDNEVIIGSAFEDLEALMTSAKEIIALAESFSVQANLGNGVPSETNALLSQSASSLGLATTKDVVGSKSEALYLSELSRTLAEVLTDDTKGVLKKEGGIMTLVDLWAVFNRARNGVELVSPSDFQKAAQLWDTLKLPVRLRRFKSGLLVVQGRDRTDEKTIASILEWLRSLHYIEPPSEVSWDWILYGRGVTVQEVAGHFGWSVGVATEELEMAEDKGAVCREQGLDGLRFWENWIVNDPL
jgi:ESCRT-II complex subunit VPS36